MTIETVMKSMSQSVAWREENKGIPEDELNSIIECAKGMPGVGSPISKKPWQIWVPHREGKLQEALACASTWASPQQQDNNFNNVKTALVFIISKPAYYPTGRSSRKTHDSNYDYEKEEDILVDNELQYTWDKVKNRIDDAMKVENEKRKNKTYNDVAPLFDPWSGWSAEYSASVCIGIGQAMAGAGLRAHELGHYVQFYTAYKGTMTWHNAFGNKFHKEGKWFPYVMMIFGTTPGQAKLSTRLNQRTITSEMHTIEPNAKQDYEFSEWVDILRYDRPTSHWLDHKDQKQGHLISVPRGYEEYKKHTLCKIPDYHIEFFMKHYGQYSSNAKKLFALTYSKRSPDWEKIFDDWTERNTPDQ